MLSVSILLGALLLTPASQCGEVCGREALGLYGNLLAESGLGQEGREHAAFVVLRDGALTMQRWPVGSREHASYKGPIPEDSIAIVHTHPTRSSEPSTKDFEVAKRLGLRVVVVTTRSLSMAESDGTMMLVFRHPGWWLSAGN